MSEENKNLRILIVDDTLKNVQVLGTILRKENYQINVAQNGLQALEMVEKCIYSEITREKQIKVQARFRQPCGWSGMFFAD